MPFVSKDPYANVPSYKLRPPTQESENSTIFKDFPQIFLPSIPIGLGEHSHFLQIRQVLKTVRVNLGESVITQVSDKRESEKQ